MTHARLLALLAALALLLAGCAAEPDDSGPEDPEPEPEPEAPKPVTHLDHHQMASNVAQADNPFIKGFQVPKGHDQLIIGYHVSGTGNYRFQITNETGVKVYDTQEQQVTSAPDSHSGAPVGASRDTMHGNHTVQVDFTGLVTYHLSIQSKAKLQNATQEPHH